jgi:hypothetical protein
MSEPVESKTTQNLAEKSAKVDTESSQSICEARTDAVPAGGWRGLLHKIATFGRVEIQGITPIPVDERVQTDTINVFTLWCCINTNILP